MNTKNNQRFQQTDRLIMDTFSDLLKKKAIEKITVSEICRLCKINRTSFYLHFTDVYDLMERMEQEMGQYFYNIFAAKSDLSFRERFIKLFTFLSDNKDFYRVYLNAQQPSRTISGIIPDSKQDSLERTMREFGIRSRREYQYCQTFFTAGLTAMVREWLDNGCQETPAELLDILDKEYSPEMRRHFNW